jgi:hypothetical protein
MVPLIFFVCLLNSFEQVPVPGVTENRYLAYAERWGWLSEGRNLVLNLVYTNLASSKITFVTCVCTHTAVASSIA